MEKSIIEGNAVDYVKLALRATGIIDPYIKEADKTPSWDGELFVYNSDNFNKSNLKAIIPVQVKGRSFKKYRNTFQVEVSDLINYKKRQNVIYFLVQFVGTEYKIYYTKLQLYDLEKIIKNANGRERISLPFELFPEKYTDKVKQIIQKFIKNAEKQTQLIPDVLSVDELKQKVKQATLTFNLDLVSNFKGDDIYSSIRSQKPYIYYKDEKGVEFAVDRFENVENLMIGHHNCIPIYVDGIKHYDGYDIVTDNLGTKIQIGQYIWIIIKEQKFTLDYKHAGTLQNRLKTLNFVLSIHSGKILSFGEHKLPIQTMTLKDKDYEKVQRLFNFYKDVELLFTKLGIVKDLDVDNLSQQQINNLYEFCQSELYDKEVSLGLDKTGRGVLRLGNVNIYCYCIKNKSKNKVYNIFNDTAVKFCLIIDEEHIPVSPYLMLAEESTETFNLIDNVNYTLLIDSIRDYGIPKKTEGAHINLLLKMLLHYDATKKEYVLNSSISLASILYEKNDSITNFINLCQAIKRKQALSKQEINKLITIKDESKELDIKLACCILLESKMEIEKYLSEMELNDKEYFLKYPLMNLLDKQQLAIVKAED